MEDLNNGSNVSGVEASTPDTSADGAIDAKSSLKFLRLRDIGRVIVGYLNINSVRNKLDALREIVSQNLDILIILTREVVLLLKRNTAVAFPGDKKLLW